MQLSMTSKIPAGALRQAQLLVTSSQLDGSSIWYGERQFWTHGAAVRAAGSAVREYSPLVSTVVVADDPVAVETVAAAEAVAKRDNNVTIERHGVIVT
jgi:hypothetical protein